MSDLQALALAAAYVAGVSLAFAGNRTALHVAAANAAWFALLFGDLRWTFLAAAALVGGAALAHRFRPALWEQVMAGERDAGPVAFFLAALAVALLWAEGMPVGWGIAALVTMGFADPAGYYAGRRWGRRRLPNGKSLEGSLAVLAASLLAALACMALLGLPLLLALPVAAGAALGEALAPAHWDNLLMPLGSLALLGLAAALG